MNDTSDKEYPGRQPPPLSILTTPSNGARLAALDRDEAVAEGGIGKVVDVETEKTKDEPVTWRSLPHRSQLIILTLARLSEPLVQTSLQVRYHISLLMRAWNSILLTS